MKNSKKKNLDTYRRMLGFTAFFCYLMGYYSLEQYMNTGKINSPKGPYIYEGTEGLFFILFFGGLAVISTLGYIYCYRKIRNILRGSNQKMKADD